MKRLYVMRHAKTEPGGGSKRDSDRILLERGRLDAAAMGRYFLLQGHGCDLVLCSDAARTQETLSIFRPIAFPRVRVEIRSDLYLAEADDLFGFLRGLDDDVAAVMFVCHNPGAAEFVQMMSQPPLNMREEERHRRMRAKFSTCSLAAIDLETDSWRKAKAQKGTLIDFMRPRDLEEKGS